MNVVRRLLLSCAAIAALFASASLAASAEAKPSLAEPAISPNGRDIAFVSGGSIWTVGADGGTARMLVADNAIGDRPVYSPDGSKLAFVSTRSGYGEIYILTLSDGSLTQLTYDDVTPQLDSWSRDGWIYFSSAVYNIQGERDILRVRATGGTPLPIVSQPYINEFFGAPSPDGTSIAFNVRGLSGSQWWRLGRSHIDESEIWIRHGDGEHPGYERVTDGGAREDWAMWAPDGKHLFYMSDRSGAQNIWTREIGSPARQVTHFTAGRVNWPTISADGKTIVFERDFGVWKLATQNEQVAPLRIGLQGVVSQPLIRHMSMTNKYTDYRLSPDGKKIAFLVHGQLFAVAASGGSAFKITGHDEYAREFSWAPDSNALAFAAGAGHEDRIYRYDFLNDARTELVGEPADVRFLTYAPAVKGQDDEIAYQQDGATVRILDPVTKVVRTVAHGDLPLTPNEPDVELAWSPDAKWIAYLDTDALDFTNVAVVDVADPHAQLISYVSNGNANTIAWTPDGRALLFTTGQRTEPVQVARIDLQPRTPTFFEDKFKQLFTPSGDGTDPSTTTTVTTTTTTSTPPSAPKKKSLDVKIDFDGIADRLSFLSTGLSVYDATISPDGSTLLLTAQVGDNVNLYTFPASPNARNPVAKQLTASDDGKGLAQWASDGKSVYYLDDDGAIQNVTTDDPKYTQVAATAEYDQDWNRDKLEAFDEAWTTMRDFYADPHTNGVDWNAVRIKYLPQFEGAQNPSDLNRLLNLMVGDLNSSHSGAYAPRTGIPPMTGRLGLAFDRVAYERDGALHITSIVPQSPADIGGKIAVGDTLRAVNGVKIDGQTNLEHVLDNTIGKKTTLAIESASGTHEVALQPANYSTVSHLRYRAWVASNRAYVDKISGGRLGYVHLPDMEDESLAQFYRDLNTQEMAKQGIVIDIRSNEGGYVNAYALDVLSRRPYLDFTSRGQPTVDAREQLGQHALEKPTVLIVNEETLSDGEDFTQGYEAQHLGPVVGEPTAGWIIFTSAVTLIDGTTLRLPSTIVSTASGQPMERHPRPVDVTVQRQIGSDEDQQLTAAVSTLLEKLK